MTTINSRSLPSSPVDYLNCCGKRGREQLCSVRRPLQIDPFVTLSVMGCEVVSFHCFPNLYCLIIRARSNACVKRVPGDAIYLTFMTSVGSYKTASKSLSDLNRPLDLESEDKMP